MLIKSVNNCLNELIDVVSQLSEAQYSSPCIELSGASIGEHTRHIVEMFQCLERNYNAGIINYDKRDRNILIQINSNFAIELLSKIKITIEKEDKKLLLQQVIDGSSIEIESNYYRELLYNLEHCIHHQALIKVAILKYHTITVDKNFGVARSTIEYRNKCVQ